MISIRTVNPVDATEILEYWKQVALESSYLDYEPDEMDFSVEDVKRHIEDIAQSENCYMIVAESDATIVGLASIQGDNAKSRIRHAVKLELSVRKRYWRQGIGRELLQELLQYSTRNGITKIDVEVTAHNIAAMKLLEEAGFVFEGLRKRARFLDGEYIDTYYLGLEINEV